MPITHKKVSAIPDGADATLVRPSDWNDTHDITHGVATLDVNGEAIVPYTETVTEDLIFLNRTSGRSNMAIFVSAVDPGVSFTITSLGGADDQNLNIGYLIL